MFKRRRAVVSNKGSDLPFCEMCGQSIRLDAATGRCALGHRVAAPAPAVQPVPLPEFAEDTAAVNGYAHPVPVNANAQTPDIQAYDRHATDDDGQSEGVVWDELGTADSQAAPAGGLDELLAWDEPSDAFSALDVDTQDLPAAPQPAPAAPVSASTPLSSELLDELDDAAYARRRAVGTIGATIAVSGAVFATVAILPF